MNFAPLESSERSLLTDRAEAAGREIAHQDARQLRPLRTPEELEQRMDPYFGKWPLSPRYYQLAWLTYRAIYEHTRNQMLRFELNAQSAKNAKWMAAWLHKSGYLHIQAFGRHQFRAVTPDKYALKPPWGFKEVAL